LKKDVFSSVHLYIEALLPDVLPLLIVSVRLSQIPEMRPFTAGHECAVRGWHRLTIGDLMNATLEFSGDHYQGRYMFIAPDILTTLDVSACQILCYGPSVVTTIAALQPRLSSFFLLIKEFFQVRSAVPAEFRSAFNSQKYPAFPSSYDPDRFSILRQSSRAIGHFPFPDVRHFNPDIAQRITE
jgi:hypothetical protein